MIFLYGEQKSPLNLFPAESPGEFPMAKLLQLPKKIEEGPEDFRR